MPPAILLFSPMKTTIYIYIYIIQIQQQYRINWLIKTINTNNIIQVLGGEVHIGQIRLRNIIGASLRREGIDPDYTHLKLYIYIYIYQQTENIYLYYRRVQEWYLVYATDAHLLTFYNQNSKSQTPRGQYLQLLRNSNLNYSRINCGEKTK